MEWKCVVSVTMRKGQEESQSVASSRTHRNHTNIIQVRFAKHNLFVNGNTSIFGFLIKNKKKLIIMFITAKTLQ